MSSSPAHSPVLVLGATGYLGRAVTRRLVAAGYDVQALVRSARRATSLPPEVAMTVGDATDPEVLSAAVTPGIGAVLNFLPPATPEVDRRTTAAVLDALATVPGRTYLYVSGVWVLGPTPPGTVADEHTPVRPIDLVAHRPGIEESVLRAASRGVRGIVVRPGVVHDGTAGIPGILVELAAEHGRGVRIGDTRVRWPMVHRADLADLVEIALRLAPASGGIYHGVAEPAVDTADLALAAAEVSGVAREVRSLPLSEAGAAMGDGFARALACDQEVGAVLARALGWGPTRAPAVVDLAAGARTAPVL